MTKTNATIQDIDRAPVDQQMVGEAQATMWVLNHVHERLFLMRVNRRRSLNIAIENLSDLGLIETRENALGGIVATLTAKGRREWNAQA